MTLLRYLHSRITSIIEERVELALASFDVDFVYVDVSGGKDSAVVLKAVDNLTDRYIATYISIPQQTHVDNLKAMYNLLKKLNNDIKIVKVVAKRRGDVRKAFAKILHDKEYPVFVHIVAFDYNNGLPYWEAIKRYPLPIPLERFSNAKRWCCSLFKNFWLSERPYNMIFNGKYARLVFQGIRREESWYRKKLWKNVMAQEFKDHKGISDIVVAPIIDFTDEEVILALIEYGIHDIMYPQYEKWKRSPNCMLCPMASPTTICKIRGNLPPKYIEYVISILEEKIKQHQRQGTRQRIEKIIHALKGECDKI